MCNCNCCCCKSKKQSIITSVLLWDGSNYKDINLFLKTTSFFVFGNIQEGEADLYIQSVDGRFEKVKKGEYVCMNNMGSFEIWKGIKNEL